MDRHRSWRPWARLTVAVALAGGLVVLGATPGLAACVPGTVTRRVVTPSGATGGASVAGAKWGSAVASADFNKDGFADLAVGAYNDQVSGVAGGTVSVFNGTASGLSTTGTRFTQSNVGAANEAGDQFGFSLAAGDFNKDTFPDLAIGAPGEAIGATKAGVVGFLFGSATGLKNGRYIDQTELGTANEAGDLFGYALTAGDFNADGFGDVAMGAPGEKVGTVKSGLVLVGKGASNFATAGSDIVGYQVGEADASATVEANDKFGNALAAGNVTGSNHADLVVGSPGKGIHSSPSTSGAIFVVPGAAGGKPNPPAGLFRTQSNAGETVESGDNFGSSVTVGNLDGDGLLDIAAGAPTEAIGSATTTGAVSVFAGASTQLAAGFTVTESLASEPLRSGDRFGSSVAIGDLDDSGLGDLVVGAPGRSVGAATAAGAAYLFSGHQRGPGEAVNLSPGKVITQGGIGEADEANDAFGAAVAVGDVNNDRRAEALIGASGEAPTGQPASGVAVAVSGLTGCASVAVEQNSRVSAMQIAPQGGAAVGTLEYAYVDNIGRLVQGHQTNLDDFSSVVWTVISSQHAFSGQPALGQQADTRVQVAGRNIDTAEWTNTQTTANPPVFDSNAWASQGGLSFSPPAIGKESDGRLILFATDANGALWTLSQTAANGRYGVWTYQGDVNLVGTPTVVKVSSGIQVFARDTAGTLRTALLASGTLSPWTSLGGTGLTGSPSVVVSPGFSLRVFVRAADGSILTKKQDAGGAWPAAWDTVSGLTSAGSPAALLAPVTGRTEVVARGTDGVIYSTGETSPGSGTWRAWVPVSSFEVAVTDPTAFTVTGTSNYSWAFVFVRNDGVRRVYTVNESTTGLTGAARESGGGAPRFSGRSLPAPPQ
jgi:FG-GAP repeat